MTKQASLALLCLFASLCRSQGVALFSSKFREDSEGFVYYDNVFRNTTQGLYASGKYNQDNKGFLEVNLGGIDNKSVYGMSGGWVREFALQQAADVTVKIQYDLAMSPTYETDEFSQALCSVDGILVGSTTDRKYIAQTFGEKKGINTTWVTVRPGTLKAGVHRLAIGAYNNRKDQILESTLVRFGYVSVDYMPIGSPVNISTRPPVKSPVKSPIQSPVKPPTRTLTNTPVKPQTNAPTWAPVKPTVKAPTRSPVKQPINATTKLPVIRTTRAPTSVPVKFPIVAPSAPTVSKLFVARINAGSTDAYVDPDGTTWVADTYFNAKGYIFTQCPMEIAGTERDALYCKERYYNFWETPQPYRYDIPVPRQGSYSVKLHFAEIVFTTKRQRVFDVVVNGKLAAKQLDIFDKVGQNTALIIPITTQISGTVVTIELIPIRENPKICGIEVMELTEYVEAPTSAPDANAFELLINCGGSSFVEAVGGRIWNSDQYFIGGTPYSDGRSVIGNTLDYSLFHSERNGEFRYEIPVPANGSYEVILHFAELYWQELGQRLFNIDVENTAEFDNVDIVALGNGARLQAVTLGSTITVSDGYISIKLSNSVPQMDNPKLSGIEILAKQ